MQIGTRTVAAAAVSLTALGITAPPIGAAPNERLLTAGESLSPGQSIVSTDGRFMLTMHKDGNLVQYGPGRVAVWATNTFVQDSILQMQPDGNVVLKKEARVLWATATHGQPNSTLELQDDGNLVVYAPGHRAIWDKKRPSYNPRIVASLGDSYSSGEGLRTGTHYCVARRYATGEYFIDCYPFKGVPYDKGTDQGKSLRDSNNCHRHPGAWPRLLEQISGGKYATIPPADPLMRSHLACSGAKTDHLLSNRHDTEDAQVQQLRALDYRPSIVTVTVGGNDFDFADVVKDCYTGLGCAGSIENARGKVASKLHDKLVNTYRAINEAAPNAKILVVGYPSIVAPVSSCGAFYHPGKLNGLSIDVDKKISESVESARRPGMAIEYLSVLGLFNGHRFCEKGDVWLEPVSFAGGQEQRSAHPRAQGQASLALEVVSKLNALGW